jgi:RNase P subunit RPR2
MIGILAIGRIFQYFKKPAWQGKIRQLFEKKLKVLNKKSLKRPTNFIAILERIHRRRATRIPTEIKSLDYS